MNVRMKQDDIELLKGIQKNAKMGDTAVNTILDKVYDDKLALQLSKQGAKYVDIYDRAADMIETTQETSYVSNKWKDAMLKSGIHMNTMFNCSNSHLAELLIKGNNMGIIDMWKNMNVYKGATVHSMELAKELADFEEISIQQFRKYL